MPTYQKIILTNNQTDTSAPVANDIDRGELALNLVDGSFYFKDTTDTIREFGFASTDSGTADPGAISQHISEDSNGVGIGTDPEAGYDLKVNGKVKLNDILYAKKIYGDGTNGVLLTGGTTDTNSSQIELSSSSASVHAIHYDADIHVSRTQDNSYTYANLGTAAPSISIGGPNTTGACSLNLGDSRTSNANSQIILRSLTGTGEDGLSKLIRDTNSDFKIINHTSHLILQADTGTSIKLASSPADTDALTSGTVNLVARDGHVRIGDLGNTTSPTDVDTNAALKVDGRIIANHIVATDENAIIWEDSTNATDGNARLTHNDGGGNIQMRWGHKYDTNAEKFTHAGDAIYIGSKNNFDTAAADASIDFRVSTNANPSIGDNVNWGDDLNLFKDKLIYSGKFGLGTASTPAGDLHVAGGGGSDNVIVEANSSDSDGARITLRTSTGTFGSKTSNTSGQSLGEIVAQGYQGGFATAGRLFWEATEAWNGTPTRNARMVVKVRGTVDSTNEEQSVMKLYPTDGGKVAINCPIDLNSSTNASLHIGGSQELGNTKDDYIEHLRLDVDHSNSAPQDHDKLVFRSHRRATDDSTPRWYSASHRIQRIVNSTHMGFIDFCAHADGTGITGEVGTNELFVFGEGNDTSTGNDPQESKFLTIFHDGRISQYGRDADDAYVDFDDLTLGRTSGSQNHGMTIFAPNDKRSSISFAAEDEGYGGLISYNHLQNRMEITANNEGYPGGGDKSGDERSGAVTTNRTEGIQIFSNGNVGIRLNGSETASESLHVFGKILATNDITAFSDERLKENIKTIPNALEKVNQLRGVEFTRKDSGEKSIGVIAQEIEKVIPEVVSTTKDEDETKSVAYGNVVGLLIEAIKDLQQEVEELKRNVTR